MHWLPKLHNTPIGASYIVAIKQCSTKPLFDVISKVIKLIFNHGEIFHRKILIYSCFKEFWVAKNSFQIVTTLNKINTKNKQKVFQRSTLPHYIRKLLVTS